MYIGLHWKYPLFFVTFQWNLNFLDRFSKNTQTLNLMKIGSLEVEFHADWPTDGQAYMAKLTVAFRNFANAPKTFEFSVYLFLVFKKIKFLTNITTLISLPNMDCGWCRRHPVFQGLCHALFCTGRMSRWLSTDLPLSRICPVFCLLSSFTLHWNVSRAVITCSLCATHF